MKKLLAFALLWVTGLIMSSTGAVPPTERPSKREPTGHILKTVVIDPGHGGKDPGAIGKVLKLQEKDLVLDVSLKLGKMIKEQFPEVKVLYTRSTDVFINLYDRAKLANANNADLFISIHANSTEGTAAFGTETWVLGLHKTEAQKAVADKENATIYLEDDGGEQYKNFDMSPDAIIIRSLMLGVFMQHSVNFAGLVQQAFRNKGRNDRGVKQGGLIVLFTATVPAVLVELGFLSNPAEEKYMASDAGKKELAQSMFEAFVSYKSQIDGIAYQIKGEKPQPVESPKAESPPPALTSESSSKEDVIFRVQILTHVSKLPPSSPRFKGQKEIFEYQQDNLYKYAVGNFINDFKSANELKNQLRQEGFESAFVIAFINGERVDLQKAIKLASKN
jgi:N-acetylmuramoyl-L-alanine amidase